MENDFQIGISGCNIMTRYIDYPVHFNQRDIVLMPYKAMSLKYYGKEAIYYCLN